MKTIFLLLFFVLLGSQSFADTNLDWILNLPQQQAGFSNSKTLKIFKNRYETLSTAEKVLDLANLRFADLNYDLCVTPHEYHMFLEADRLWNKASKESKEKQLKAFLTEYFLGAFYEGNKSELYKELQEIEKGLSTEMLYILWNSIVKGKWAGEDKSLSSEEVLYFKNTWNDFLNLPPQVINKRLKTELNSLTLCKVLPGPPIGAEVVSPLESAKEVAAIMLPQLSDLKGFDQWTGKPGAAAFLGALYGKTKDKTYLETSLQLFNEIEKQLLTEKLDSTLVSGATGIGLSALFAYRVSKVDRFLEIAKHYGKLAVLNSKNDYAEGATGIGIFKLNLYLVTKDQAWLNEAREAGDQLIITATQNKNEAWWEAGGEDFPAVFAGFGHGSAGMGYFLIHLYKYTKNEAYKTLADKASAHVLNSAYRDRKGDLHWTWYQPSVGYGSAWKYQWSHGNFGIAYFFSSLEQITPHKKWQKALAHTMRPGIANAIEYKYDDGTQCCGKSGQGDLYLTLYRETKDTKYLELAKIAARYLVETDGRVRDYSGREKKKYDMSYSGIAGIGLYFLQLDNPQDMDLPYQIYSH